MDVPERLVATATTTSPSVSASASLVPWLPTHSKRKGKGSPLSGDSAVRDTVSLPEAANPSAEFRQDLAGGRVDGALSAVLAAHPPGTVDAERILHQAYRGFLQPTSWWRACDHLLH